MGRSYKPIPEFVVKIQILQIDKFLLCFVLHPINTLNFRYTFSAQNQLLPVNEEIKYQEIPE